MGTRNLTMVIMGGKTRIAQYGQWDGYPDGQGAIILAFLRSLYAPKLKINGMKEKRHLKVFQEKLEKLEWITQKDIDKVNADPNWKTNYPYLSRDCGGAILEEVYKRDNIKLKNSESFAGESLFCEWAYVIDFDKGTFEVYKGFNKTPLTEEDRFFTTPTDKESPEYFQVKLAKSYPLKSFDEPLPSLEKFVADFKNDEEE